MPSPPRSCLLLGMVRCGCLRISKCLAESHSAWECAPWPSNMNVDVSSSMSSSLNGWPFESRAMSSKSRNAGRID